MNISNTIASNPKALLKAGQNLISQKKFGEAIAVLEKAASLNPADPDILSALATANKRAGKHASAFKYYEAALQLNPLHLPTLREVGTTANFLGFYDKAKKYLSLLNQFEPSAGLKVSLATMLPHIMESIEQIEETRQEYEANLEKLLNENIRIDEPDKQLIHSSFYLAYHGKNDCVLQKKLAQVYENICSSLTYTAKNLREKNHENEKAKIKIGFFSKYFGAEHPVCIHFGKVIEGISKEPDIELVLLSKEVRRPEDKAPDWLTSICTFDEVPDDLNLARRKIEKHNLDILIYTEIGMDPFTYFLAFSRLAKIQCAMGGHPDTTGINNIDYYISSNPVEPENAQKHYTEKLLQLENLPVFIKKTPMPEKYGNRKAFGLPENLNLYVCPMMLQKMHPDFDIALKNILEKDDKAMILLFSGIGDWQQKINERFKKIMPAEFLKRIGFIPHLPKDTFALLLSCADVVLDSFHFGGGTTNFVALSIGAPLVTFPGEFHRGRVGYALYNAIGFTDLIAKNFEDYVDIAVKVAKDKKLQKEIRNRILSLNNILFENLAPIKEFAHKLKEVCNRFN